MVKLNAPELLCQELSSPKWEPQTIVMSGVTDCYQPVERKLKLTRRCLEVLAEFRNPVAIITKNFLVTRDIEVLSEMAKHRCASVCLSLTTLDNELRKVMEPRTSPPAARVAAIRKLAEANIPVSVNVAPIIPGLTDHEVPNILKAARDAGATAANFTVLRLAHANAPLFEQWLQMHFPERKDKVLNRIRAMRGGKMYDAKWGKRFGGEGIFAQQIEQMFQIARRKAGFNDEIEELSTAAFRRPGGTQLSLFDGT
jgi:DNA repair photolyase